MSVCWYILCFDIRVIQAVDRPALSARIWGTGRAVENRARVAHLHSMRRDAINFLVRERDELLRGYTQPLGHLCFSRLWREEGQIPFSTFVSSDEGLLDLVELLPEGIARTLMPVPFASASQ